MDTTSIREQLRETLTPELLLRVHDLRFPWPKGAEIDWDDVVGNLRDDKPEVDRATYKLLFPVWLQMSKIPLEELLKIDMTDYLPPRDAPTYPEQSLGLVMIFDNARQYLKWTSFLYAYNFFNFIGARTAETLFDDTTNGNGIPSPESPFSQTSWLSRGWTFSDYIARVDWLWSALIHSEEHMTLRRSVSKGYLIHLRNLVESHTKQNDPYASSQLSDEKDLLLTSQISSDPAPRKSTLGRDVTMMDFVAWNLRMMTGHFAITDRFGRYPYWNDLMGREYREGEEEWMKETKKSWGRLPEKWRGEFRRQVETGEWEELEENPKYA